VRQHHDLSERLWVEHRHPRIQFVYDVWFFCTMYLSFCFGNWKMIGFVVNFVFQSVCIYVVSHIWAKPVSLGKIAIFQSLNLDNLEPPYFNLLI
jgi:hypothetical protein